MLKVSIIDDITDDSLYCEIFGSDGKIERTSGGRAISHGMVCSSVFLEFAPKCNAFYISLDDCSEDKMSFASLAEALNQAIILDSDLICMSVGSTNYFCLQFIQSLVKQAAQKNIAIFCACSNENVITYPASLPEVIGVRFFEDKDCPNGRYKIADNPFDGIELLISLPHIRTIEYIKDRYNIELEDSNSIAVQYAAAMACKHLNGKRLSKSELLYCLKKDAVAMDVQNLAIKTSFDSQSSIVICYKNSSTRYGVELQHLFLEDGYSCGLVGTDLKTDLTKLKFNIGDFVDEIDPISPIIKLAKLDVIIIALGSELINQYKYLIDVYIHYPEEQPVLFGKELLEIEISSVQETYSKITSALS